MDLLVRCLTVSDRLPATSWTEDLAAELRGVSLPYDVDHRMDRLHPLIVVQLISTCVVFICP